MKANIWVLCTVLADENAPAMPAVFADEAEAWAKYDEVIRAEWDNDSTGGENGSLTEAMVTKTVHLRLGHAAVCSLSKILQKSANLRTIP